jgi:sugar O-acyltransferase (sialic acid O-acetyltransferase NeuD family)
MSLDEIKNQEFKFPDISYEMIDCKDWIPEAFEEYLLGVNISTTKETVYNYFNKNLKIQFGSYKTIMHDSSMISETVTLLNGIVIHPNVSVAPFSHINHCVTINRNTSIGHHVEIGKFTTIHPGANIAGHCKIGDSVTIGMGSNIINGVRIGDHSIVGAGSLVTKDIPANVMVFGSPATIKKNIER